MFFVYLLRSEKDKSFYIGFAEDLKARIKKHEMGLVSSTKNILPMKLIPHPYKIQKFYDLFIHLLRVRDCEVYKSKKDALIREKRLKKFAKGYASLKGRLKYSLMTKGEG